MNTPRFLICPICQESKQKSKVFYERTTCSAATVFRPYWDEEGCYHSHDPNTYKHHYRCTNGHSWETEVKIPCPTCET